MADELVGKLRDEIIECQKVRSDFIKWKLILVAAVGSAALGLGGDGTTATGLPVLLAFISLICVYVDSVCIHNDARIMVIAEFLRGHGHDSAVARKYEELCDKRRTTFSSEGIVLAACSALLSVLAVLIGAAAIQESERLATILTIDDEVGWVLSGSGAIGLLATLGLHWWHRDIQTREPLERID